MADLAPRSEGFCTATLLIEPRARGSGHLSRDLYLYLLRPSIRESFLRAAAILFRAAADIVLPVHHYRVAARGSRDQRAMDAAACETSSIVRLHSRFNGDLSDCGISLGITTIYVLDTRVVVEAAGVELFSVLTARKLLILRMANGAKRAPLANPLYVYCTKISSRLDS